MIPYLLAAVGGYLIGDSIESKNFAEGGAVGNEMWESIKRKFSEVFFEEDSNEDEIYSNEVKAEEHQWMFDRYSPYASPLSWQDAENKFLSMLTPEEKKIISIEHNIKNIHELFGLMSEKKILVKRINKMADGGDIEEEDMSVQFIDYKDKMIMFEPHFKKYYSNDIEFDSLEEAKKYIDSGSKRASWEESAYRSGMMAKGGMTFQGKADAVKKRLVGTEVPKRLRKDYGKEYNEEEAEKASKRIIGAQVKKYGER